MDTMRKRVIKYMQTGTNILSSHVTRISSARLLLLVLTISLGIITVGLFLLSRQSRTREPQTAIVLQQSYDGSLPVKPIDQAYYQSIIQSSWDEALERGSANIVNFPNDPNLVAFQYRSSDSTAPASFVLYRNKPIILRTKKVLELPNAQSSRLTLSHEKYQLVALFEFTPEIKELNIGPILENAFDAIVQGK